MTTATKQIQEPLLKNPRAKTYAYEQVLKSSISYFNGDELAATTWMNKYAMKDNDGEFVEQSPDDMHKRMAKEFGRIEADYKLKYNLNGSAKFLSKYGQEREDLTEENEMLRNFVPPDDFHMGDKEFSHIVDEYKHKYKTKYRNNSNVITCFFEFELRCG